MMETGPNDCPRLVFFFFSFVFLTNLYFTVYLSFNVWTNYGLGWEREDSSDRNGPKQRQTRRLGPSRQVFFFFLFLFFWLTNAWLCASRGPHFLSTFIFLWILVFPCAFEQLLILLTVFIFSLILLFPPLRPTCELVFWKIVQKGREKKEKLQKS